MRSCCLALAAAVLFPATVRASALPAGRAPSYPSLDLLGFADLSASS